MDASKPLPPPRSASLSVGKQEESSSHEFARPQPPLRSSSIAQDAAMTIKEKRESRLHNVSSQVSDMPLPPPPVELKKLTAEQLREKDEATFNEIVAQRGLLGALGFEDENEDAAFKTHEDDLPPPPTQDELKVTHTPKDSVQPVFKQPDDHLHEMTSPSTPARLPHLAPKKRPPVSRSVKPTNSIESVESVGPVKHFIPRKVPPPRPIVKAKQASSELSSTSAVPSNTPHGGQKPRLSFDPTPPSVMETYANSDYKRAMSFSAKDMNEELLHAELSRISAESTTRLDDVYDTIHIVLTLTEDQGVGLGLAGTDVDAIVDVDIEEDDEEQYVTAVVESVVEGGAAYDNGNVCVGDRLVKIDADHVFITTHSRVVHLLSQCEGSVELVLARPRGGGHADKVKGGVEGAVDHTNCESKAKQLSQTIVGLKQQVESLTITHTSELKRNEQRSQQEKQALEIELELEKKKSASLILELSSCKSDVLEKNQQLEALRREVEEMRKSKTVVGDEVAKEKEAHLATRKTLEAQVVTSHKLLDTERQKVKDITMLMEQREEAHLRKQKELESKIIELGAKSSFFASTSKEPKSPPIPVASKHPPHPSVFPKHTSSAPVNSHTTIPHVSSSPPPPKPKVVKPVVPPTPTHRAVLSPSPTVSKHRSRSPSPNNVHHHKGRNVVHQHKGADLLAKLITSQSTSLSGKEEMDRSTMMEEESKPPPHTAVKPKPSLVKKPVPVRLPKPSPSVRPRSTTIAVASTTTSSCSDYTTDAVMNAEAAFDAMSTTTTILDVSAIRDRAVSTSKATTRRRLPTRRARAATARSNIRDAIKPSTTTPSTQSTSTPLSTSTSPSISTSISTSTSTTRSNVTSSSTKGTIIAEKPITISISSSTSSNATERKIDPFEAFIAKDKKIVEHKPELDPKPAEKPLVTSKKPMIEKKPVVSAPSNEGEKEEESSSSSSPTKVKRRSKFSLKKSLKRFSRKLSSQEVEDVLTTEDLNYSSSSIVLEENDSSESNVDDFNAKNVSEWSTNDVVAWLKSIQDGDFAKYAPVFKQQGVDGKTLLVSADTSSLKALGLASIGHRTILKKLIKDFDQ
eukprot:m.54289 g.54289  ORF g.54289 m.54289 type:complete len:1085 (-) comp7714_c0_seq2:46-3300(-)